MSKYVFHFCKNKECNNGWVDEDLTGVKSRPPMWKYCEECCRRLGIDFDSQKPDEGKAKRLKSDT